MQDILDDVIWKSPEWLEKFLEDNGINTTFKNDEELITSIDFTTPEDMHIFLMHYPDLVKGMLDGGKYGNNTRNLQ